MSGRPSGRKKAETTGDWSIGKPGTFLPVPNKPKSYELIKLDQDMLGKCMQFITGHAHMNQHQNLVDSVAGDGDCQVTPWACRLCGQGDETPLHLITECDETVWDARNILGGQGIHPNPYDPRIILKWGVQKLIQFLSLPKLQPLLGGQVEGEDDDEPQEEHPPDDETDRESDESNDKLTDWPGHAWGSAN